MTKIIAVANQKGGVGKTTTAVNLSACLVQSQKKILLVDLDPQGNATMGSGVDKHALPCSMNEVLLGTSPLSDVLLNTAAGYDLCPSNGDLTEAEIELMHTAERAQVLSRLLKEVKHHYDFILIDAPPALNTLTLNALVACDAVLIPMQCEYYALEGLAALLSTIDQVKASINPTLRLEGVLRTLYDARNRLSLEVSKQLLAHFDALVYRTVIPRNVRLAEAPSHGLPVFQYDRTSAGASAYMVLAAEFLGRQRSSLEVQYER